LQHHSILCAVVDENTPPVILRQSFQVSGILGIYVYIALYLLCLWFYNSVMQLPMTLWCLSFSVKH